MLRFDEILFAISLVFGGCLVLGGALGMTAWFDAPDVEGAPDGDHLAEDAAQHRSLGLLGVGRVPLAVVMMLLSLSFGGIGLIAASVLHGWLGDAFGAWLALVIAAVGAILSTRSGVRLFARAFPSTETYAGRKGDLVGSEATVIVSSRRGDAVLRALDRGGAELRLRGRTSGGVLRAGDRVLVVAYDAESDSCRVEKLD